MGGNILLDQMVQLAGSSAQFGLGGGGSCSTSTATGNSSTLRQILPFHGSAEAQLLQSAIPNDHNNTETCSAASFLELLAGRPLAVAAAESAASHYNLQNSLAMHVDQSSRKTLQCLISSNPQDSVPISPSDHRRRQMTLQLAVASPNNSEGRAAVIMATSNSPGSCTASSNDYSAMAINNSSAHEVCMYGASTAGSEQLRQSSHCNGASPTAAAHCASLILADNKNNNKNTVQKSSCITTSRDQQSTCSSTAMRAPTLSPVSYLFPSTKLDNVLTRQASNAPLLLAHNDVIIMADGVKGQGGAAVSVPDSDSKMASDVCRTAELDGETKAAPAKKKRKRSRTTKNLEELESQRMTHIAVERNRRRQMNDHLNALRSLMPPSYIQRGDQASIVGGAIRFVEELEQVVQCLHLQKRMRLDHSLEQLVAQKLTNDTLPTYNNNVQHALYNHEYNNSHDGAETSYACFQTPIANVEVKMVSPSSILLKILAHKQPRQLLNTLAVLNKLQLKVVHLSITTIELTTLYSFNLEMEQTCQLQTIDEITKQLEHTFSVKSNIENTYIKVLV